MWLNSPPVPVEAGQLIRIQGWVLIRKPITGSVDGLLVSDSLGGECLAARIQHTKGWEPFTLYRIAPQSGAMTLTIALSGFGEACIDDVTVQPLLPMAMACKPRSGDKLRGHDSRPELTWAARGCLFGWSGPKTGCHFPGRAKISQEIRQHAS